MGKKKNRKSTSISSSGVLTDESSACESPCYSNNSRTTEDIIPENLVVLSVESAGIRKYANCLQSHFKDVFFVHSAVKTAFNIEDLALVKGKEKTILCHAHRLDDLKKNIVVFPKWDHFEPQELVTLARYNKKVKDAEEVLITCSEMDMDQKMIDFMKGNAFDSFLYVGMPIQWTFFDTLYTCTITKISYSPDISDLSLNEPSDSEPQFYYYSWKTFLKVDDTSMQKHEYKTSAFENIGGMESQIQLIRRHIQMFLDSKDCDRSTFRDTLMLYGPSGTGKTLLLEAVCHDYKINIEKVVWYSIYSKPFSEEGEEELKSSFQNAVKKAPSIIIIDEFNCLCPSRTKADNIQRYMTKVLTQLIETLHNAKVMIIAATKDLEYDDSVFQSSERVETIHFQLPTSEERIEILKKLLSNIQHTLTFDEISECAKLAHGFTGKALSLCIHFADLLDAQEVYPDIFDRRGDIVSDTVTIKYMHLKRVIKLRKPFVVAADNMEVKKVTWTDIGGMKHVKEKLTELVEWPLKHPEAFKHFNITPPSGVLMYGPSGCSKTMIAKALETECELNFISKNVSDLFNKYVGESEKAVRDLFALAKAKLPCIIFLDEIDALAAERGCSSGGSGVGDRIVNTLLTEISIIEKLHGVIILAATHRPDVLDEAFIRNGRISHSIYVSLPDSEAREEILKICMKKRVVSEDVDYKYLATKTEGYTGAEIVILGKEAAFQLLHEDRKAENPTITLKHFEKALKHILPRTSKEMIQIYESFGEKFCQIPKY